MYLYYMAFHTESCVYDDNLVTLTSESFKKREMSGFLFAVSFRYVYTTYVCYFFCFLFLFVLLECCGLQIWYSGGSSLLSLSRIIVNSRYLKV